MISKYTLSDRSSYNLRRTQDLQSQEISKISTWEKFDRFADIKNPVVLKQFISLRDDLLRSQSYLQQDQLYLNFLNRTSAATERIKKVMEDLNNELIRYRSTSYQSIDIKSIAQKTLQNIQELLNIKIDNKYVFGGIVGSKPPVNIQKSNIINGVAVNNYCELIDTPKITILDAGSQSNLSVQANHPGFINAIGSCFFIMDNQFDKAADTLYLACNEISNLTDHIMRECAKTEQFVSSIEERIADRTNQIEQIITLNPGDVAEIQTRNMQLDAQISYQMHSISSKFKKSLADYL